MKKEIEIFHKQINLLTPATLQQHPDYVVGQYPDAACGACGGIVSRSLTHSHVNGGRVALLVACRAVHRKVKHCQAPDHIQSTSCALSSIRVRS